MSKITPKNLHKTLSKHILVDHFDVVIDLEKSHGQYIHDSKTNRDILDCFSYIASNPIGHNHPGLNEPAFENLLLKCSKTNPSNSDILSLEYANAVDTFAQIAKPKEFKHLFFVAGGSVAVENALKAAFDWKTQILRQKKIKQTSNRELEVLHFFNSFSGRTGYSLSITNTDPIKYSNFPKFRWPRFDAVDNNCSKELAKKRKDDIKQYIKHNKKYIAAIIIEPIMGEGGDIYFPKSFHKFLREITLKNDILLIYDEVQTGIGLTGKMWAYQNYDIVPDLVSFGKKAQVCGFMSTDRINQAKQNVFNTSSRINSTWGANLTDFVRMEQYLKIIERERLVENAKETGKTLLEALQKLQVKLKSNIISNVRGLGLMCAFDMPDTWQRNQLLKICLKNNLFILGCGEVSVRFRPSLNFSQTDVQVLMSILKESIKELELIVEINNKSYDSL